MCLFRLLGHSLTVGIFLMLALTRKSGSFCCLPVSSLFTVSSVSIFEVTYIFQIGCEARAKVNPLKKKKKKTHLTLGVYSFRSTGLCPELSLPELASSNSCLPVNSVLFKNSCLSLCSDLLVQSFSQQGI